jgi:prepilin-type N-terminal cleavage/methylation domain-containing protein
MRARRHSSGFTLVELMTVVAIVGIAGALAARFYSKSVRGENGPSMARSIMATMLDAHHTALTLGNPVRVTLDGTSRPIMTTAQYVTNQATQGWVNQATLSLPATMRLCQPSAAVTLGTVSPTCPLSTTAVICFYPNGHVDVPSSNACSTTTPSTFTGATIYFGTHAGDKNYRVLVWGLTGMVKLVDTW